MLIIRKDVIFYIYYSKFDGTSTDVFAAVTCTVTCVFFLTDIFHFSLAKLASGAKHLDTFDWQPIRKIIIANNISITYNLE